RHFLLIAERSDFWITTQVPDEDHVIDHCQTPPAARTFPKGGPADARIHLGDHRDRRPAAADPLLRAQPRAAPANFSGWPSHPCRRVQPEKSGAGMRAARPQCAVGSPRGPAYKPVTGAAVCAWRGVWAP